jgi:ornithine carbamoyltransferase
MAKHFLQLLDQPSDVLVHLLERAARIKAGFVKGESNLTLKNKLVALVFEKPSLRTRVSFEAAAQQLGASSLFQAGNEVGLGTREPCRDFARTMSQYVNAIVLRVFKHQTVKEVAEFSSVPVVNGLSDTSHPCQAMADYLTIQEVFGSVKGKTLLFIGDGNNVSKSLAVGAGKLGVRFILACPSNYGFDAEFLAEYRKSVGTTKNPEETNDPLKAVKEADIIYTDVWTSMGQEAEKEKRLKEFSGYQINSTLMSLAPKHARIMHCLPAHRGEEITDETMESSSSVIFQQAGNRLHAQKAILEYLIVG